ncbi:uncharacterized protein MELLADRAFT_90128 [Melampsora larici-populina 98AG31]|uniref:Secreted protein n=1 Tax=Melampsora larici-populina (strain 98AG31 / pathotype 3-4-7) TaxID=747676 RepID=F4RVS7_MELLP|nr:uncharacterized protein MELLADRAFT_90128 [Melampsora larici-populina 98AG31]EGG03532.1 secreted protein [Melampsora larici-populina 98AG31]
MHISFAYLGFVLAASAAASPRHLARTETVARLSVRSEEQAGGDDHLKMKCFGGCGGGLPVPGPTSCWNAPVVFHGGGGLPPMNTFFSTVQSYAVITSNTVNIWNGGLDPQSILLQFQIMVTSLSTLFSTLQGGCSFQGNPQIFISTFSPLIIQIQSMLTIINTQCVGIIGSFQSSFAVLSVLIQSIVGVAITFHVEVQQFFSACNFNPQLWSPLGFPVDSWIHGVPGVFPGVPGGFGPGGFPGVPGGFPGGVPGGFPGGVPIPVPGGVPVPVPGGVPVPVPGGVPVPVPGGFPVPVPGGPNGCFRSLGLLSTLLHVLIVILDPLFHGLGALLQGVGLLVANLGTAVGGLLDGGLLGLI